MFMDKTKTTYRWIVYEDGDRGQWHLTEEQVEFLQYLKKFDFLRSDVDFEIVEEELI